MLTNKDLKEVHHILAQEPRLLKIKGAGSLVFVGDTHGDCDASKKVLKNYLVPNTKIVFLGDYVDRGGSSIENINFLLSMKLHYPEQIFLLMGNHEGYGILRFSPTDFWEILSCEEMKIYKCVLSCMPYALTTENGIIALHGVLPDLDSLEKIDEVKARALGVARYIEKPIAARDLAMAVREVLDKGG